MPSKADRVRDKKRKRLKKILLAIGEGPKSFSELEKVMEDVDRRTLYYNLDDLKALDLIFLDDKTGKYCSAKSKVVKIFNSKRDYELALEHSRKLALPKDSKHLDTLWIQFKLDELGNPEMFGPENLDARMLVQHIETGYPNISAILGRLKSLYPEIASISDRLRKNPEFNPLAEFGLFPSGILYPPEEYLDTDTAKSFAERKAEREKILTTQEKATIDEAENLGKLLIGEIVFIGNSVKHGIPLKGYCDHCPHLRVSIKD